MAQATRAPSPAAAAGTQAPSQTWPRRAGPGLIGRQRELSFLLETLTREQAPVVSIYGPAGIGKSALLAELAQALQQRSIPTVLLDGRAIEPSAAGFLSALAARMGLAHAGSDPETVLAALAESPAGHVLIIDIYDRLWLLDGWLCTRFAAALPPRVGLVLASRRPLGRNWRFASERAASLRLLPLGALAPQDAAALLAARGVPAEDAASLAQLAGGHPLALHLIGAVAPLGRDRLRMAAGDIVHELAELFLEGIEDRTVRHAVEAAACVRRLTVGLLRAMLPDTDAEALLATLRQLPLFEAGQDGLVLHEAVRSAIAAALRATDPERAAAYPRAAWRHIRTATQAADPAARWQCCADIIFLLRNPAVRAAFFPGDTQPSSPGPVRPGDADAIAAIVAAHDSQAAAASAAAWLERDAGPFRVVRADDGRVDAFYWAFNPFRVDYRLLERDPVTAAWWAHLRTRRGVGPSTAVFVRRHLCREHGEGFCPAQAACWLDIKHLYMEMRPRLRWVYTALRDPEPHQAAMAPLGFRRLEELTVAVEGIAFQTLCLDMGSGSFDTWIARVVASELGAAEDRPFDAGTREMVIDGRRVPLTPMEFGVLSLLHAHEGQAVSRDALLDEVWGEDWDGSSNVVEAVIKSLRRKLGPGASRIHTIRGVGYMYRV